MMGYYWGNMMGGFSFAGILTWIVVMVDLILLGVFLWQKIKK
ncbi:MAG: hypothetical protein Q8P82_02525 [bacterium]|nr:hypothetical protein [bacterium]